MRHLQILDKKFNLFIPAEKIDEVVHQLADRINHDFLGQEVIIIGILDGAFIFTADLSRCIKLDGQVTFLKISTYCGLSSSASLKHRIKPPIDIKGKNVILVEDVIDTGFTIFETFKALEQFEPLDLRVVTLLYKPGAIEKEMKIDYVGMEIPNTFVVGYGMDYNGYGRQYKNIYSLI